MSAAVIEMIHRHRSIRRYDSRPIPDDLLNEVLAAGLRASSSGNMQAYSVIITTDPEIRRELYEPHFAQSMVLEAPVFLTFCADFHRMRRWMKLRKAPENFDNFMSFMIGAIDACLASQNVALAAESKGLGICYLGTTLASCDRIAKILQCPKQVVPVVGFSLGYPAEDPAARDRLPLDGVVHRERYETRGDREILESYKEREEAGWARYMAHADLREKVAKLGAENLAQIYTKVKYTRESHIEYSQNIFRCLEEQGFI